MTAAMVLDTLVVCTGDGDTLLPERNDDVGGQVRENLRVIRADLNGSVC